MQPSPAQLPLASHLLFASRDLDEARARVAAVFCPHRLNTIGRNARLDARQHHLPGERLSLNYIEYGAKTLIAPGELTRFYLLQIPLAGGAAIVNGVDRYYSSPDVAAVLNPHLPTTMIWEQGCRQLLVQIDRRAMQDHLTAQLGAVADRPLTFAGPMDMTRGAGAALRRLVLYLVAEADAGTPPIGQAPIGQAPIGQGGLMARQIESAVLSGLLEAAPHNYSRHLGRVQGNPLPRQIKLAEDYIAEHLNQPITVEDMAQASGSTPRALQLAFRRFRGTTPMGFWRAARLMQAHRDLMAAGPETSVTDVALRWGFSHFGRFGESYRARFGVSPRDTLRAARGIGYQD